MSKLTNKSNFTIASNAVIMDSRVSYKAKGVYLYLCSRPDGWDFFVGEISSRSSDGIDSVRRALKELESLGYIRRTRTNGDDGRFFYDYEIYQTPSAILPQTGNPYTVEQHTGLTVTGESNTINIDLGIKKDLTKTKKQAYDFEFDSVWDLYGFATGKKDSYNAYKKLTNEEKGKLENAFCEYDKYLAVATWRSKASLASFLNGRHWEDNFKVMAEEERRKQSSANKQPQQQAFNFGTRY